MSHRHDRCPADVNSASGVALAGFGNDNADNVVYAQQYSTRLLDRAFWQARPEDTIGLLFTYFAISGTLGKVQAQQVEFGLPVSNSATGIQTNETILEANYNVYVYRGVDFRLEFQYVIRPNASAGKQNAKVTCGLAKAGKICRFVRPLQFRSALTPSTSSVG